MTEIRKKLLQLNKDNKRSVRGDVPIRVEEWKKKSRATALRIMSILQEKKLTKADFAKLLDVTPQYVSKIVSGNENFTYDTISKIESVLKESIITIPGCGERSKYISPVTFVNEFTFKIYNYDLGMTQNEMTLSTLGTKEDININTTNYKLVGTLHGN